MGSVIDGIKTILREMRDVPVARMGHLMIEVLPEDEAIRVIATFDQGGPSLAESHAGLTTALWNALPQMLRVFDRVEELLAKRKALHQACCGSPLANRLMREMEKAEEYLEATYNELLYPQRDHTPYRKENADGDGSDQPSGA